MVDVLIPTRDRTEALAVTLTSLCFQDYRVFCGHYCQSGRPQAAGCRPQPGLRAQAADRARPVGCVCLDNFPRRGMAQQRQFFVLIILMRRTVCFWTTM